MQKIRMVSRKAWPTSGKESPKSLRSKNALRTSGQPAELAITTATTTKNTTVLVTAIPMLRVPRRSPRIRERRSPRSPRPVSASALTRGRVLLQDGSARLVRQPLLLDLRNRPGALQRSKRLVDARGQAVALGEHHAEVLWRADGRELPDDRRLGDLDGGDVEGRGEVDDDPVDLVRLQAGVDVARGVVDGWLLARLDVLRHVGVARRPDLDPELVLLDVGTGFRRGDRRPFEPDQRLVDVVVGIAEVDALRARGRVRDLVDVEVEALRARLERLLEGDDHPVDIAFLEAELPGDRVGDRALEALARVRVADLPRRPFRRGAAEPGRERRIVGADRQLSLVDEVELVDGATGALRRSRLLRATAAAGRNQRQQRGRSE